MTDSSTVICLDSSRRKEKSERQQVEDSIVSLKNCCKLIQPDPVLKVLLHSSATLHEREEIKEQTNLQPDSSWACMGIHEATGYWFDMDRYKIDSVQQLNQGTTVQEKVQYPTVLSNCSSCFILYKSIVLYIRSKWILVESLGTK